jgi:hypothetical protein
MATNANVGFSTRSPNWQISESILSDFKGLRRDLRVIPVSCRLALIAYPQKEGPNRADRHF